MIVCLLPGRASFASPQRRTKFSASMSARPAGRVRDKHATHAAQQVQQTDSCF
jgi:hypothetical protein